METCKGDRTGVTAYGDRKAKAEEGDMRASRTEVEKAEHYEY